MSQSPEPSPAEPSKIDRETTTPFLLNFCYRASAFHNLTDFPIPNPSNPRPSLPPHVQIYTWYSCTLRELAHLLTSAMPAIVPSPAIGTRLSFRLVYPDTSSSGRGGRLDDGRGRYISREVGSVVISAPAQANGNSEKGFELGGDDAEKTLSDARFVIGDYIDCAVFPPLSDGSVVPRASGSVRGSNGFGRSRGGGFGAGRASIPTGEWRRGERLPDSSGYRGGGYGRGSRRGPY